MSKAFALADDFEEYSNDVQVILTTHSPAFYGLHNRGSATRHVSKDIESGETIVKTMSTGAAEELDQLMGIMPLISPYVATAVQEYKDLIHKADELRKSQAKKPTLFVEGPSDVAILRKAFGVFLPDNLNLISIQASKENGGGEGWVTDMLIAWMHAREKLRAAGLFDNDKQGKTGKAKVVASPKYADQPNVRVFLLKTPEHLHAIFRAKLNIGVCLEEILPPECWRHAQKQGWLTQRRNLLDLNPGLATNFNVTVSEALAGKNLNEDTLIYLKNEIAKDHKESFSRYISRLSDKQASILLAGFRETVQEISDHLSKTE